MHTAARMESNTTKYGFVKQYLPNYSLITIETRHRSVGHLSPLPDRPAVFHVLEAFLMDAG